MSGHLDLDALADLLAGEGDDAAAAHLEGCAACSAALVDLDAALVPVAAELAALAAAPLPAPPPDLEERLRALVAAEPVPPAVAPAPERPVPLPSDPVAAVPAGSVPTGDVLPGGALPGGVVPLRPRARPRRAGLLGVAAGAVGLLAVAGLGLGLLGGSGTGDGVGTTSETDTSVLAAPPELPARATGTDYRSDGDVFARALPGLLGGGTDVGADVGTATDSTLQQDAAPAQESAGGTTSGGGTGDAAGGAAAAQAPEPAAARVADPLERLRDPVELAGCLAELTGPQDPVLPLALDYATFEGQPALVVVLPSARADKVDVFAVGAGCRAGDDRTLFFTRLDRPA